MKNMLFWGYPGLCLCLLLTGCATFRPGSGEHAAFKNYRLNVAIPSGENLGELFAVMDGLALTRLEQTPRVITFSSQPYDQLEFIIRLNDQAMLDKVIARLQSNGIRLQQVALQN